MKLTALEVCVIVFALGVVVDEVILTSNVLRLVLLHFRGVASSTIPREDE
jgi:hypothetical protein